MRFGEFEVYLLTAGGWYADGGSLFGVVPKLMWAKQKPPDDDNLVRCSCVAAVIRHRGRVAVCETGIGTKLDEKLARRYRVWEPGGLLTSLGRLGVRPEEVDLVLTTHLHWDHAGGLTRRGREGGYELTFPRARHVVQRSELEFALAPDVRSRAAYIEEDVLPVADAGLLEVVDGEAEILPGLWVRQTGGHTPGHQVIVFRASSDLACAITGDLVGCALTFACPGYPRPIWTSASRWPRRPGCSTRRPSTGGCWCSPTSPTSRPATWTLRADGRLSPRSRTSVAPTLEEANQTRDRPRDRQLQPERAHSRIAVHSVGWEL